MLSGALVLLLAGCYHRATVGGAPAAAVAHNGTELQMLLSRFGELGLDQSILLPPGTLSLRNVSLAPSTGTFSKGKLVIQPLDPGSNTVLDAGMQSALTPPCQGAVIELRDITVVNSCQVPVVVSAKNAGYNVSTAAPVPLFSSTGVYQSLSLTNTRVYVSPPDLAQLNYMAMAEQTPFPAVKQAVAPLLADITRSHVSADSLQLFSMRVSLSTTKTVYTNVTFMSIDDPTDPLLQSMRALGTLMDPRICGSSSPLPSLLAHADFLPSGPMLVAMDTATLIAGLWKGITFASKAPRVLPMCVKIGSVSGIVIPKHNGSQPGLPPLNGSLVLMGAPAVVQQQAEAAVLDLNGATGTFILLPGAQFYIHHLAFVGLAVQPMPAAPDTSSALPLAPFRYVNSTYSGPLPSEELLVWLYNVTLHLPPDDYLAFAILAHMAGMSSDTDSSDSSTSSSCTEAAGSIMGHVALLQQSIISMGPSIMDVSTQLLCISSVLGWGMNATRLCVLPTITVTLPECLQPGSASHARLSTGQLAGVVVGAVCAAAMSTVAVVALFMHRQRYRRSGAAASSVHLFKSDPAAALKGTPSASTGCGIGAAAASQQTMGSALQQAVLQAQEQWLQELPESVRANACMNAYSTAVGRSVLGISRAELARAPPVVQHQSRSTSSPIFGASTSLPLTQVSSTYHSSSQATAASMGLAGMSVRGASSQAPALSSSDASSNGAQTSAVQGSAVQATVAGSGSSSTGELLQASAAAAEPAAPGPRSSTDSAATQPGQEQEVHPLQEPTKTQQAAAELQHYQHVRQLAQGLNKDANQVVITGVLGVGGGGSVYLGYWRNMPVALKTCVFDMGPSCGKHLCGKSAQAQQGISMANSAIMEAAIAASVGHRNVVCTYMYDIKPLAATHEAHDEGQLQVVVLEVSDEGAPVSSCAYKLYLVQELCSVCLAAVLNDSLIPPNAMTGAPDLRAVLHILLDIAQGLEYLHSNGVVHGDLKPANVLLSPDSSAYLQVVCKLTDFGLSVRLGGDATHMSNYTCGTAFYIAPEVISQHRVSKASDIFSLGVIMWQLALGETPYATDTAGQYRWNPHFPYFAGPKAPPLQYQQLASRCLAIDPQNRPHASEVVKMVRSMIRELVYTGLSRHTPTNIAGWSTKPLS